MHPDIYVQMYLHNLNVDYKLEHEWSDFVQRFNEDYQGNKIKTA